MLAAFDIETSPIQGGEKPTFILGCLLLEGREKAETYYTASSLWERIIEIGKKEHAKGKTLTLYAHNIAFDFYNTADLSDSNIHYFCQRPFIASYRYEGREIIKFIDTMNMYRMSLAKVGEILNIEKWDTPLDTLAKPTRTTAELEQIAAYCTQDCKITLQSIIELKNIMKLEGIMVKRLYTINQIAINFLINTLRKGNVNYVLMEYSSGQVWPTKRNEEILEAYRGGRNEAFKTGEHHGVNYIDINSLYPYALAHMPFPDLRSERKIYNPLNIFIDHRELFARIGVSKCLVYNKTDTLGLLAVRTSVGNYYPTKGSFLYGSWTHFELSEALDRGYEILSIEYSIIYQEEQNPFTATMEHLYTLRQSSPYAKYFYKQLMNAGIGKMAQHHTSQDIIVESVESVESYIAKGFDIIDGHGMHLVLSKQPRHDTPRKKYYMPIIPTLVNAYSRVYMYQFMKLLPQSSLIYTDTDSIMFQGNYFHLFPIGEQLGEFKIEVEGGHHINYGKKTYRINDDIKVGGIRKKDITTEDFDNGMVLSTQMHTIATSKVLKDVGSFHSHIEDLTERKERLEEIYAKLKSTTVFIDEHTTIDPKSISILKSTT